MGMDMIPHSDLAAARKSKSHKGKRRRRSPNYGEDKRKLLSSELTDEERHVEEYTLKEVIGRGASGVVYRAEHEDGSLAAVKRVNLRGLKDVEVEAIQNELRLLSLLQHANVVQLLGHVRTQDYLHIILEYMDGGALTGSRPKHYTEEQVKVFTVGMLDGLAYLHSKGVVHRDTKGANILVNGQNEVKLTDFGVSAEIIGDIAALDTVGTPYWMAPEVIQQKQQTTALDVWAAGCTVVELLTGHPPNYQLNPMAAMYAIVEKEIEIPKDLSDTLVDFLKKCFVKDPTKRATAQDLLQHPWLATCRKEQKRAEELTPHAKARERWLQAGRAAGFSRAEYEKSQETLFNLWKQIKRDEDMAREMQRNEIEERDRQKQLRLEEDEKLAAQLDREEKTREAMRKQRVEEAKQQDEANTRALEEEKKAAKRKALEADFQVHRQLCRPQGHELLKFGRRGKPHRRLCKLIRGKQDPKTGKHQVIFSWSTGRIDFSDVLAIKAGKTTAVFEKYRNHSHDVCFSLITNKRTLDLACPDAAARDEWVSGLNNVLSGKFEIGQERLQDSLDEAHPPDPS